MAALVYPSGINGVLTPYGTSVLLTSLFQAQPALPHIWLALLWSMPSDIHDGLTMPEVQSTVPDPEGSGLEIQTGYQRAYYPSVDETGRMRWNQSSSRSVYNIDPIIFPQAESPWGAVRGWAITDALKGGNIIAGGMMDVIVDTGDQVVVDPNNLGFVVIQGA